MWRGGCAEQPDQCGAADPVPVLPGHGLERRADGQLGWVGWPGGPCWMEDGELGCSHKLHQGTWMMGNFLGRMEGCGGCGWLLSCEWLAVSCGIVFNCSIVAACST